MVPAISYDNLRNCFRARGRKQVMHSHRGACPERLDEANPHWWIWIKTPKHQAALLKRFDATGSLFRQIASRPGVAKSNPS